VIQAVAEELHGDADSTEGPDDGASPLIATREAELRMLTRVSDEHLFLARMFAMVGDKDAVLRLCVETITAHAGYDGVRARIASMSTALEGLRDSVDALKLVEPWDAKGASHAAELTKLASAAQKLDELSEALVEEASTLPDSSEGGEEP
jgi:hypothetical protein